jgi:hypothetical protein
MLWSGKNSNIWRQYILAETISISHRHTACCQRFIVLLFGVSGDHHHNVTDASSKLRHLKRDI